MKKKGYLKFKFMSKYEVDFWGYLTSCSIGKRFFKKMFKIFLNKNRFKIPMVEYMLKRPFMKFNYSRMLEMKKKIKNYSKPYIAYLHNLLRFKNLINLKKIEIFFLKLKSFLLFYFSNYHFFKMHFYTLLNDA